MKNTFRQILLCAAVLILLCAAGRFTVFKEMTTYIPCGPHDVSPDELQFIMDEEDMLRYRYRGQKNGYLVYSLEALRPGGIFVEIRDRQGDTLFTQYFSIGRTLTIHDLSADAFTGDKGVLIALTAFWFAVAYIMLKTVRAAKGTALYSYSTLFAIGFLLFTVGCGGIMLYVTIRYCAEPYVFNMASVFASIGGASVTFMFLTMPAAILFAAAMAVSNIALLRHEKPRVSNILGILTGILMAAGEAVLVLLYSRDFSGSEWEYRINNACIRIYATVFVYFECMLAASVICGLKAAKHEPAPGKKAIIILGCWIRPDGSLPPLLRGRADRAILFWRKQKALNGTEAMMIPSGGQGPDEPMSEAEAMRGYLLSQNIPENVILPETRSSNTKENMKFSGELLEKTGIGDGIVYSTTGYHVFRSGILASEAGLAAEGIGSKTKWWFWPNAFMRECLGLLAYRWKDEAILLICFVLFFGLLTMIL